MGTGMFNLIFPVKDAPSGWGRIEYRDMEF